MRKTKNPYPEWWTDKEWRDKDLIEFCDCHGHAVSLGILWDGEEDDEWAYLECWYQINPYDWSWRERLSYIWAILTGNVCALWEIILNKQKALRFARFILACVGEDDKQNDRG